MKVDFKKKIREIKDFPQKGIMFRDITPLLGDKKTFKAVVREMVNLTNHLKADKIVGIDARGFILAGILAEKLGAGMTMVRKLGKLPFETESEEYDLEYGKATLQIHKDAILPGEKVIIVDDVLATGGTMSAAVRLVERLNGEIVGIVFLASLDYLNGKNKLNKYNLISLVNYSE